MLMAPGATASLAHALVFVVRISAEEIQAEKFPAFSSLVFMISGYLINLWLGKQLGPASYGIYGVIISLIN